MTLQCEETTAESSVAAWTMGDGGAARRESVKFGGSGMDVVSHHRTAAAEAVSFVHCQIVTRPREQPGHFGDLLGILIQVGLEAQAVMFLQQGLADLEHRLGSR